MGATISSWMPVAGPPLSAVDDFDLGKYAGKWYQVAFLPNWFQKKDATNVTATYTALPNGSIRVENESFSPCGKRSYIQGVASKDPECSRGEARLMVQFTPNVTQPLVGPPAPYWVIQLADDYRYAVVSEPSRQYLWILSRQPSIASDDLVHITERLVEQGFDKSTLDELVWTRHSDAGSS